MIKTMIEKNNEIATHYGFRHAQSPNIKIEDLAKWKLIGKYNQNKTKEDDFSMSAEEKISVIKRHVENSVPKQSLPIMLYHNEPIIRIKKRPQFKNLNLDIIGINKGIAEATIIKTAFTILEEEGFKNIFIDINSTGDKESLLKFVHELNNYYRKNITALPDQYRQTLKRNPLEIFFSKDKECQELNKETPKPINFLSEHSRRHFKEVIEYLEAIEAPYKINHDLVSKNNTYSKTIFEIKTGDLSSQEDGTLLARGGRYDELAEKVAGKRHFPAVGISMCFKQIKDQKPVPKTDKQFKLYLIQLGFEAKLKSLKILEILRRSRIPVCHHLGKDKLTEQLLSIKELGIPHTLIIGHKEAKENTVILRNMDTMAQKIIPIEDICGHLKYLK